MSQLEKKSFSVAGHRTSVALEPEFWAALQILAERQNSSMAQLIAAADYGREAHTGLASTLRLFVLRRLLEGCSRLT